jgi:hypothetical protein
MRSVTDVKNEINRHVDYYTSKVFAKCIVAERGYHLVRALDQMVSENWFVPWKPVINYHCKGPDEIEVTIREYQPLEYTLTITKGDVKHD